MEWFRIYQYTNVSLPLLCCDAHCCRLDNTSCLRRTCIASEAASVLYELLQTSAATQWWPLHYRRQAVIRRNLCDLKPRGGQSHFLSVILLQQQVVRNGSKKWRVTIGGVLSSWKGSQSIILHKWSSTQSYKAVVQPSFPSYYVENWFPKKTEIPAGIPAGLWLMDNTLHVWHWLCKFLPSFNSLLQCRTVWFSKQWPETNRRKGK